VLATHFYEEQITRIWEE